MALTNAELQKTSLRKKVGMFDRGDSKGSLTAKVAAACRAIESRRTPQERLFHDPYAAPFAEPEGWELGERTGGFTPRRVQLVALKTRFIDDYLRRCLREGARQVVILGAGYDSRALRIKELQGEGRRVFELDHLTSHRAKVDRVKEVVGYLPAHVAYIPSDFVLDSVGAMRKRLLEAGYDPSVRSLFLMEALAPYLEARSVDRLLEFITAFACPGSFLYFESLWAGGEDEIAKKEKEKRAQAYIEIDEPILYRGDLNDIQGYLGRFGFRQVHRLLAEELKGLYRPQEEAILDPSFYLATAVLSEEEGGTRDS